MLSSFSRESTIAFLALATRPRSLAINLAPEVVREEGRRVVQDNLNNWSSVAGMNFITPGFYAFLERGLY